MGDKWSLSHALSPADEAVALAMGRGPERPWNTEAVLEAVRRGGDPNLPTTYGRHLIDAMLYQRDVEGVRALIALGADVAHPDASLPSLFGLVADARRTDTSDETTCALVALLIEHGADVCYVHPVTGNSVLAEAALLGDVALARLLLDADADPGTVNREGESPLALARGRGHQAVEALLVERGAPPLAAAHDEIAGAAIAAMRQELLDGLREQGLVLYKQDYGPPRDSTCDYYFYWDDRWREARRCGGGFTSLRVRPLASDEAVVAWMKDNYAQCYGTDSEHAHFVALRAKLKARPPGLPTGEGPY